MEYVRIFTDDKYESEDFHQNRQYYRINVYACDDFFKPILFEHIRGMSGEDDFDRSWEVFYPGKEAESIREAIKRIDNYKFSPKESKLCHRE